MMFKSIESGGFYIFINVGIVERIESSGFQVSVENVIIGSGIVKLLPVEAELCRRFICFWFIVSVWRVSLY